MVKGRQYWLWLKTGVLQPGCLGVDSLFLIQLQELGTLTSLLNRMTYKVILSIKLMYAKHLELDQPVLAIWYQWNMGCIEIHRWVTREQRVVMQGGNGPVNICFLQSQAQFRTWLFPIQQKPHKHFWSIAIYFMVNRGPNLAWPLREWVLELVT